MAVGRLQVERLATDYGDAAADEALARDLAGGEEAEPSAAFARYLSGRTAFFDRVTVDALERGVRQVVSVGAGYDGRAFRYARAGVRWWEVDHPATQADKRARLRRLAVDTAHVSFVAHDLRQPGLAAALDQAGFEPDAPALITCEGVMIYLPPDAIGRLLEELRSVAACDTRLAFSAAVQRPGDGRGGDRKRLWSALRSLGEPPVGLLTAGQFTDLLQRTGWRRVDGEERSEWPGLVLVAPT